MDLGAAEDTRVTRGLLTYLGVRARLISYHLHNWQRRIPTLLEALAKGDVALVTDAGMPGISDPGSELVAQAAAQGFEVDVAPGPSSVITALAVSGMDADSFIFLDFTFLLLSFHFYFSIFYFLFFIFYFYLVVCFYLHSFIVSLHCIVFVVSVLIRNKIKEHKNKI